MLLYRREHFFLVIGNLEHFFSYQKSVLDFAAWNIKFMQNRVRQTKWETERGIMQNKKIYYLDNKSIPLEEYTQEENPVYT